jgi:hypothetical protein
VTSGVPANPGWVVPSMTTGSVTTGRAAVTAMVCGPLAIWKRTVSAPALALASSRAWRSDPAPASAVEVTVNTAGTSRASSCSMAS